MPSLPYIISGKTKNSLGNNVNSVIVTFTTASGDGSTTSNSNGDYLFDLASIGFTSGETVSYTAIDAFNNENVSSSFVHSGQNKDLDITLSVRSNSLHRDTPNRGSIPYNIGGKAISRINALPVEVSGIPLNEGSYTLSYDASNNLIKVVKVISSRTYTLNLTYDGSDNLTTVSRWVIS